MQNLWSLTIVFNCRIADILGAKVHIILLRIKENIWSKIQSQRCVRST